MNIQSTRALIIGCGVAMLTVSSLASAAELRLKCERRFNRSQDIRSTISVDGKNLFPVNAMYSARVISGPNQATHAPLTAVGDEVEFDFSSKPNDIAAGATAIPVDFIVNGTVRAAIFNADGQMVVGPVDATCRLR
jgi:hypothetical protein